MTGMLNSAKQAIQPYIQDVRTSKFIPNAGNLPVCFVSVRSAVPQGIQADVALSALVLMNLNDVDTQQSAIDKASQIARALHTAEFAIDSIEFDDDAFEVYGIIIDIKPPLAAFRIDFSKIGIL